MVFGKQLCIYKDERDTLMVAMVGILRGQGFISWGSNRKYNFLWLFTFFFMLMLKLDGRKFPDASSVPGEEGKMELILTTALVNKTCQNSYWDPFIYFFLLFYVCLWYWQPRSATKLVKVISLSFRYFLFIDI